LNEATKSSQAGAQNVLNSFLDRPAVSSDDYNGHGAFDPVLNTPVGRGVVVGSALFNLFDTGANLATKVQGTISAGESIITASTHLADLQSFAVESILTNSAVVIDRLNSFVKLSLLTGQFFNNVIHNFFPTAAQAAVLDIQLETQPNKAVF